MARLPEEWIDEVVSRNDIVDVVSEYVVLKHSGKGYFGLCPFHNEKTPSFSVSPDKQFYHCFGCGEGGGIVSFVMNLERLEFLDAVKLLAEKAGMPLPDTLDAQAYANQKDVKEHLYEINRACARFYHQTLYSAEGKAALTYLYTRGLSDGIIKAFGLGFAPDSWDRVLKYLRDKGYEEKQLLEVGIVVENKDKERIYDRFRNRIIFPIIHPRGMVMGFGGRVMDDSLPKYLNSPESPIFNKSTTLFGLNLTRKLRPLEYTVIVEGYMDVITMHQYGLRQAVASLGTSLTQEQAKIMRRYAPDIYIAYDGDTAGQNATLRGLDILYEAGCKVKVIQFPKGKDPDEILKQYGQEYFKKLMDKSSSLVDYKLDRLKEKYDLDTQDGKVDFGTEAAQMLQKVDNLIERETHIQRLEGLIGIKSRVIYDQIHKLEGTTAEHGLKRNINGNNRDTRSGKNQRILLPSYIKAERYLLNLLAQGENNALKIMDKLGDASFEETFHQEILEVIRMMLQTKREISSAQILKNLDEPDKERKLVDIFNQEMEYDNIDTFISDCLEQVERRRLEKQREEIRNEVTGMDQDGIHDPVRYKMLLQQLEVLNRKVNSDRQERREWREKRRI